MQAASLFSSALARCPGAKQARRPAVERLGGWRRHRGSGIRSKSGRVLSSRDQILAVSSIADAADAGDRRNIKSSSSSSSSSMQAASLFSSPLVRCPGAKQARRPAAGPALPARLAVRGGLGSRQQHQGFEIRSRSGRLLSSKDEVVAVSSSADAADAGDRTNDENLGPIGGDYSVPFWPGQIWHFVLSAALVFPALYLARGAAAMDTVDKVVQFGLGMTGPGIDWFWMGMFTTFFFQCYLAMVWRCQLNYDMITNTLGEKWGINVHLVIFCILLYGRVAAVTACGFMTSGTMWAPSAMITAAFSLPLLAALYSWFSVQWVFGTRGRAGIDHFYPKHYGQLPLVETGVFKYVQNPLYSLGAFCYIIPAMMFGSYEGTILGVWVYLVQWIIYFTVEKEDMKEIYG